MPAVELDRYDGISIIAEPTEPEAPSLMDSIGMLLVLGLLFGIVTMISGNMKE